MPGRILIIDDDVDMCEYLAFGLTERGFETAWKTTVVAALDFLATADVDVIMSDVSMPGMSGLDLCEWTVANRPDVPVVLLTGAGNLETAIAAIRAGAYDFIVKPPDLEALALALKRAEQHRSLRNEVTHLRRVVEHSQGFGDLVGASPAMQKVYDLLERVVDSDASVLLAGESGTGKELVARALHRRGRRRAAPFVAVNCAAFPEALIESELFGHVRGAFTDARAARPGLFQNADGGTLFLDEIAELPLALQPKLLRVLQERTVRAVGADREVPCDVRIVAASNEDLDQAVRDGRFREDLYFRINVIRIELPPLRVRGSDVLLLAQHFVDECAARAGRRVASLSPSAAERLLAYQWPGNVRELQNCIERAVALTRYEQIMVEDLPERVRLYGGRRAAPARDDPSELPTLEEVERQHCLRVLDAVHGNKVRAARILGLDRKTLYRKLLRLDAADQAPSAAADARGISPRGENRPTRSTPRPGS